MKMIAFLRSSEDRDRTYDLRVMSPTSYRCSTSRCGCKCTLCMFSKQTYSLLKLINKGLHFDAYWLH